MGLRALGKLVAICFALQGIIEATYDVTIVGYVRFEDGLGRLPISITDMLKNDLSINHIGIHEGSLTYVPLPIQRILQNPDKTPGNVSFLTYPLWLRKTVVPAYTVPKSPIKIAYSMIESTAPPKEWVPILNTRFDAVAVPDKFLVEVYTNAGVTIPIFVLEHLMYLDNYLQQPLRTGPKPVFTFGSSATLIPRKNYELILEAFSKEFGNNSNVRLRLHARYGSRKYAAHIRAKMRRLNLTNIELIERKLSDQEYLEFLKSLDCYVYLSKGEGFSLTPREAMACGIPCIVSDNTAHKTLCKTGLVMAVPSNKQEPAYYHTFSRYIGYNFNCETQDVCKALRKMYSNYPKYLQQTAQAREWVKRYSIKNLRAKYIGMIKPKKIQLGTKNKVDAYSLTTNSKKLYNKYFTLRTKRDEY